MKDVQGIQRGKCNAVGCECEEYRTSSTEDGQLSSARGRLRCEYCDHTPVQHVKIIELGECRQCGKDNCDKYEFEDPNSYKDCAYCDCPASAHAGAEKLRKPTPQPQQQQLLQESAFRSGVSVMPGTSGGGMGSLSWTSAGFQPRLDASGQPTQLSQFGTCKLPGCVFPRRIEGNKVHEFCSRTCAKKYSQLQTQGVMMSSGAATSGQMFGQAPAGSQPVHGSGYQKQPPTTTPGTSMNSYPVPGFAGTSSRTVTVSSGSTGMPQAPRSGPTALPTTQSSYQSATVAMCKKCGQQPANPGRGWCQSCFIKS